MHPGKAENPKWNDLPFQTSSRLWPFNKIMDLQFQSLLAKTNE
jgi:hypothetical protein